MQGTIDLKNKSDIELYKDFLIGNKEAFNTIIQKYRQPLILFIMKYVKDINISEDLAQDTFLYIIINRKDYDFKYSLKTYLYTIAKCRALNYLKKEKRIAKLSEKLTFVKNEGYDYSQDMEYENNIYYKIVTDYEEYETYTKRWNNLVEMNEKDFENYFIIITAVENFSMIDTYIYNITTDDDTLYLEFDKDEDKASFDIDNTVLSIKLKNKFYRDNIKINILYN